MNKFLFYCSIVLLSVSCRVYQTSSVSIDKALDNGKVKIVRNNGEEIEFKSIHKSDSGYVGRMTSNRNIPFSEIQVESVYIIDKSPSYLKKNMVYLSVATINYSLNYERIIFDRVNNSFMLKASGGKYVKYEFEMPRQSGLQFSLQGMGIMGRSAKHFEYALGIIYRFDKTNYDELNQSYSNGHRNTKPIKDDFIHLLPAINIGYRYQKPKGHIIFRIGGGYPEILYLSFGAAF